ncbi:MAG: hypothetical protein FJ088_17170, partial [Deltaproteobacteria bacterium]|nr:hypothetical protein [Deltaproteobacteria bacterium]
MKIILAYSAKRPEKPEETDHSYPEEVKFVSYALQKKGHVVEPLNASLQIENVVNRLRNFKPDLIFNLSRTDERRPGDYLYPAVFEQAGFAFTGSSSAALAVSTNRFLTRIYLREHNIPLPRCRQINRAASRQIDFGGFFFPAVVKPNFERNNTFSRQICLTLDELLAEIERTLQETDTVIVDEYFYGRDVSVFFIDGVSGQFLEPVEIIPAGKSSGVYP